MSGSSESLQSSVQNSFQLVPEGQWLVHSMEDDEDACRAFGTVDLMSCIGVYVQVTKEHFFLAHILDDFTCKKGEDGLLKFGGEHTKNLRKVLIEERDEDKVKKMKINLGKNLDVLVEQGLQVFKGFKEKDLNAMANKLVVHYGEEYRKADYKPNGDLRAEITKIFEDGIETWASTKNIEKKNSECPPSLLKQKPEKAYHASGFIVQEPSKFAQPVWITSFVEQGVRKEYTSHVDESERVPLSRDAKSELNGDGELGLTFLFGDFGL